MKAVYKILVIILLLCNGQVNIYAQEPVKLICLEVENGDNVRLWWVPPVNATGFEKYIIFYSTNGNTFFQIDEINLALTNNYLHIDAQAVSGSKYYFVDAVFGDGTFRSDTLQTIYLQVNNPGFNQADLYWNRVRDPLPDGSSDTYNIYKEFPPGNWILTNTSSDIEYSEPVIICNDSINFRIEIENTNGCKSVSNVRGAWFKILDEPAKPVIDSISVNEDEHIVIGWEAVGNAEGYIIYRFESGTWFPINSVSGMDNTFYEDLEFNPCSRNTAYTVATIDTCGSSGPKDENEERQNIRIYNISFDACTESVSLNWNNYRGPEAETYQIWASEDGGDFIMVGENTQGDSSFVHPISNTGSTYSYFIRAKFSAGTSTTCKRSIKTIPYTKPQHIYLANADVLPTNEIMLTADVDTIVKSCTWQIWRNEPVSNSLTLISSINRDELTDYPLKYTDQTASPNEGFYFYYITVLDSCGNKSIESNDLKTIWLTGTSTDEDHNLLEWNAFEGWDAGVEKYYIFRMIDGQEPGLAVDSVSNITFQYTDDISSIPSIDGPIYYWVQAIENEGNSFGYLEKTNSNRTGVALESEMYVANAFRPNGYTTEFKPVFRFYNGENYLFQIYNRWGKLIFETNNPANGWNGTFDSRIVQQGVYAYRLVYQKLDKSSVQKNGTVTVIY